jgi:hypothetical protein
MKVYELRHNLSVASQICTKVKFTVKAITREINSVTLDLTRKIL